MSTRLDAPVRCEKTKYLFTVHRLLVGEVSGVSLILPCVTIDTIKLSDCDVIKRN